MLDTSILSIINCEIEFFSCSLHKNQREEKVRLEPTENLPKYRFQVAWTCIHVNTKRFDKNKHYVGHKNIIK
jgi:hypothetical protein